MVASYRSDTSEDEMDDQDIQKLLIVTQTPPAYKKHSGSDRTATFISKNKLTSDIAQAINDGLYFYEQVRCRQMITAVLPFTHDFMHGAGSETGVRRFRLELCHKKGESYTRYMYTKTFFMATSMMLFKALTK